VIWWFLPTRISSPTRHDLINFPLYGTHTARRELDQMGKRSPAAQKPRMNELMNRALAARFGPAAVLVNPALEVVYFHGNTESYLARPTGVPTSNLLDMARDGIRHKLQEMVTEAFSLKRQIRVEDVRVRDGGAWKPLVITASPVSAGTGVGPLVVLTFETIDKESPEIFDPVPPMVPDETDELVDHLQGELRITRFDLESTIQELENINNDLRNLLTSTDIATIFLDDKLHISWFSPAVRELFSIITSDVGRPITDFSSKVQDPDLFSDAREVLQKLEPIKRQVKGGDKWYMRRTLPYRTLNDRIEGVVITFTDITDLLAAREQLEKLNQTLETQVRQRTRQLRKLSLELSRAEENERRRIAEVLHDDLQQILTGARYCLDRKNGTIRLKVEDRGRGFDPGTMESTESKGFGLLNVRERITATGGEMDIESYPEKGTRIIVTIPETVIEEIQEQQVPEASPGLPPSEADQPLDSALRILLVDDHEVMREGLRTLLKDEPGIEVIGEAPDGETALDIIAKEHPEIVLMDVSMPGMGGVEATRRIQNQFSKTAVIALSMYDASDRAEAMIAAGAHVYVQKTASLETLLSAIQLTAKRLKRPG
jgi:CheY-like chemotaxis protein